MHKLFIKYLNLCLNRKPRSQKSHEPDKQCEIIWAIECEACKTK